MVDDEAQDDVLDLLGLLAYFELSDAVEIAGAVDGGRPVAQRLATARHARSALARCESVLDEIGRLGEDGAGRMERFDGVFDDFDVRTVASTRSEQVLRDFVGRTVTADFCRLVSSRADETTRQVIDDVVRDGAVEEDLVQAVAEAADVDPVLSARLALWGRRVVGEAFRLVQELLVERAAFARLAGVAAVRAGGVADASDESAHAWILRRLTEQHAQRMRRLGLAA